MHFNRSSLFLSETVAFYDPKKTLDVCIDDKKITTIIDFWRFQ